MLLHYIGLRILILISGSNTAPLGNKWGNLNGWLVDNRGGRIEWHNSNEWFTKIIFNFQSETILVLNYKETILIAAVKKIFHN